jgi:hypothetical protein
MRTQYTINIHTFTIQTVRPGVRSVKTCYNLITTQYTPTPSPFCQTFRHPSTPVPDARGRVFGGRSGTNGFRVIGAGYKR